MPGMFDPEYTIFHDYGGPVGAFNPYNALVMPDGTVRYRNPADPYGVRAPHAFQANPNSIGLAYGGEVGAKPTPEGLASLQAEFDKIRNQYPNIKGIGHGQAFDNYTHHTFPANPTTTARDIEEAAWRQDMTGPVIAPTQSQATQLANMPAPFGVPRMALGGGSLGAGGATPSYFATSQPPAMPAGPPPMPPAAPPPRPDFPPQEPAELARMAPSQLPNPAPAMPDQVPGVTVARPTEAPSPPDVAAAPSPITTAATAAPPRVLERRGDMSGGGGMAPLTAGMGGGGGFGNYLQNVLNSPAFIAGAMMLAGGDPAKGVAIAKAMQEQTLFRQQQAEYNKRQQIWNDAFPGGQPNTSHTLLKGLTPEMAATIYSLGPEAGLPVLGKYQLADAEARQAMERQLEQLNRISGTGFGTSAAPAASPAAPPSQAPASPLGQTVVTPPAGTVMEPPRPITAGDVPPALAPTAPAQGAPPPARPAPAVNQPMVSTIRGPMTIPDAERFASQLEFMKIPTGELRQSISRAAAGTQAAATTAATKQAEQEANKPQARATLSQLLDSVERTESLATKIHNNPNLGWATGMMSKLPTWTGGETYGVQSDMNQLVKQVGLSTLQALREASKTGSSGLGSTSEVEIKMLQNALAALDDPAISTEKYKENLNIVIQSSQRIRTRMLGAWKETYGEPFREPGGDLPVPYPTVSAPEAAKARANEKMKRGGWEIRSLD